MYITNKLHHRKCFVRILFTRCKTLETHSFATLTRSFLKFCDSRIKIRTAHFLWSNLFFLFELWLIKKKLGSWFKSHIIPYKPKRLWNEFFEENLSIVKFRGLSEYIETWKMVAAFFKFQSLHSIVVDAIDSKKRIQGSNRYLGYRHFSRKPFSPQFSYVPEMKIFQFVPFENHVTLYVCLVRGITPVTLYWNYRTFIFQAARDSDLMAYFFIGEKILTVVFMRAIIDPVG